MITVLIKAKKQDMIKRITIMVAVL